MTTRRTFLKSTAASAAALSFAAGAPAKGEADKLNVALIGCGGMGKAHLNLLIKNKQLNVAYLCDADEKRLADFAKVASVDHPGVKTEKDMRKIFDDKAVN